MKLADLRKLSIKRQSRIRFVLPNGMECLVNEHGIAQVPMLHAVPDFNLEEALAATTLFSLEEAASDSRKSLQRQTLSRDQLAALAAAGGSESTRHDDHEE
jgi:hypothetical protein